MVDDDNVIQFPGAKPPDTLASMLGLPGFDPFARKSPTLLPRRTERVRFTVRIDLDDVQPPIWRRLQLASDLRLNQLHDIVQNAMGWTDSHLHHFVMGPGGLDRTLSPFLTPFALEEGDEGTLEAEVRLDEVLAEPNDRLYYEYDFGDGWEHTIRLEKVEPWTDGDPLATCTAGRRACPPEDVGGIGGYAEMLDIRAGRTDDMDPGWVEQVLTWLPEGYDPEAFSVGEVNELLDIPELPPLEDWPAIADLFARMRGAALADLTRLVARATDGPAPTDGDVEAFTHRYRHLLRTVGAGVTLTAAGYLPPKLVDQIYRDLEMDGDWIGKGNREEQTAPVLYLRTTATALGLLRKARGRLTVTAAGAKLMDDPPAMLRHIASRVPFGKPYEKDAGLIALLVMAAGDDPYSDSGLSADILAGLGWRVTGGELEAAAYQWSRPTLNIAGCVSGWLSLRTADVAARALLRRP